MTVQITVRLDRAAAEIRVLRGGESAVAAAVEERDRQWREHIESGRPLIFNHRGAVAPAVTTSTGVTPAEVEDENLD